MRCMVIDIGSNTVKYDVFSVEGSEFTTDTHASVPLRFISYIKEGVLEKTGFELLCETLLRYKKEAEEEYCDVIAAFATASLRKIADPQPVIDRLKERTGLSIRLLSGEEEAACSFTGMLLTCPFLPRRGVMLDMGGGSTEFNFFEEKKSLFLHSCPFGALSLKNRFAPGKGLTAQENQALFSFVQGLMPDSSAYKEHGKTAVLVGGTAKACGKLATALLGVPKGKNVFLRTAFTDLYRIFRNPTEKQWQEAKRLCPDRYQLLSTGTAAFECIFETLSTEQIVICSGGIREGFLPGICGLKHLQYRGIRKNEKNRSDPEASAF